MFNFNKPFFEKHQTKLLFIANKWYLRWLLGLNRLPKNLKGKQIDKITPNSVHHKNARIFDNNSEYKIYRIEKEIKYLEKKKENVSKNDKNRQLKLIQLKREFKKARDYFFGQEYTAEFFTRPRFAEALAYNLSPFCYFQELRSPKMVWRFSPMGLVGMFIFGLLLKKNLGLPFALMGTTTDYPSGAGDGRINTDTSGGQTFQSAHDAAAGHSQYTGDIKASCQYYTGTGAYYCYRGFIPVDTSGISTDADITAAKLYLYATTVYSCDDDAQLYLSVVQTFQASTSGLVVADYQDCGSDNGDPARAKYTPIQKGTNDIDHADIPLDNYSEFTLNATGLSWIVKDGWTKLGIREGHDIENIAFNAGACAGTYRTNGAAFYASEQTGTDEDPYLSVTYTTTSIKSVNGLAYASIKSINGLAIASIKNFNGLA